MSSFNGLPIFFNPTDCNLPPQHVHTHCYYVGPTKAVASFTQNHQKDTSPPPPSPKAYALVVLSFGFLPSFSISSSFCAFLSFIWPIASWSCGDTSVFSFAALLSRWWKGFREASLECLGSWTGFDDESWRQFSRGNREGLGTGCKEGNYLWCCLPYCWVAVLVM